jgi:hypothetical protein
MKKGKATISSKLCHSKGKEWLRADAEPDKIDRY